jgi:hypothetical protein
MSMPNWHVDLDSNKQRERQQQERSEDAVCMHQGVSGGSLRVSCALVAAAAPDYDGCHAKALQSRCPGVSLTSGPGLV